MKSENFLNENAWVSMPRVFKKKPNAIRRSQKQDSDEDANKEQSAHVKQKYASARQPTWRPQRAMSIIGAGAR